MNVASNVSTMESIEKEKKEEKNMMIREILLGLGIIGFIILVLIVALLPLVCTIIIGTWLATPKY